MARKLESSTKAAKGRQARKAANLSFQTWKFSGLGWATQVTLVAVATLAALVALVELSSFLANSPLFSGRVYWL